ncbi:MAG TPA: 4-alpha-glucanotransferase, partial [Lacibacter sp.]|nr:4-alpha-glucanotransferase [Lacibacter sp.]
QQFHFRISMMSTLSFKYLDDATKRNLEDLYVNYFFRRQDEFWRKQAMDKLPQLKRSTNMLICGEDLGMVPDCVPDVMKQLGLLSLEIQRMPKDPKRKFFHPADAPYMSVVTPSTHDMSTIRGWWEEDRAATQSFYNSELSQWGEAPYYCEPNIVRSIISQHVYSPAMWSIFQVQELLGMSAALRRENPNEERINVPANPKHYWRYRMHLNLEDLIANDAFNEDVGMMVQLSGRG